MFLIIYLSIFYVYSFTIVCISFLFKFSLSVIFCSKLSHIFNGAFEDVAERIENAKFFNSGYKGIAFKFDDVQYNLLYDSSLKVCF